MKKQLFCLLIILIFSNSIFAEKRSCNSCNGCEQEVIEETPREKILMPEIKESKKCENTLCKCDSCECKDCKCGH